MEIPPVGAEWFRQINRRTDMTKQIVAIRNFANGPEKNSS